MSAYSGLNQIANECPNESDCHESESKTEDWQTATTFVITNNHFVGQAVANAKMLQTLFDQPPRGEETEHLRQLVLVASAAEQGSSWVQAEDDSSDHTPAGNEHFQPRLTNI